MGITRGLQIGNKIMSTHEFSKLKLEPVTRAGSWMGGELILSADDWQIDIFEDCQVYNGCCRFFDRAKSPYQRVLDSDQVDPAIKEKLTCMYNSLSPVELWKSIQVARARILKIDRLGSFWGNDDHYS